MCARRSGLAAVVVPALAGALAATAVLGASGCGGVSGAASSQGNQLAVYSSLPLQGPSGAISKQIVNGEKLALYDSGGQAGQFKVSYASLDDSNPASGRWDPGVTASNAKTAAEDPSTIAYLGDYDSTATAISLPLVNAAGILQVSPASPYGGLTSSLDAGQDEPERFYPTGKRNFARLEPGDQKQAQAQIQLMRSLGVRKLYVLDDQNPFELPLAQMVVTDAEHAGIEVAAHDSLDTTASGGFAGEVAKIAESGAEAVFFAGAPGTGAIALFGQLHSGDPKLWLLGTNRLADSTFTSQLAAPAAAKTLLTTPVLPASSYPASARRVLADYRRRFGERPEAYALFGYEAMSATLQAIRRAGARGGNRQAVIDALFAEGPHESAIGRYSIEPDGETTLPSYGVDRVSAGKPVFWRALNVG
ncbi:MAG TPA: branched-chain amino acid ABC transporter substrate-binding protein [Solirubrobacteraceae bacterium]|nr:branched-chain amino acid ABC transporter substrate-binding protein [Solirubrobacteraceae bacterium]